MASSGTGKGGVPAVDVRDEELIARAPITRTTEPFSHSRLSCYEQCPRKYELRYVLKVEVEEMQGIEAFTGSLVHLSLQHLHQEAAEGRVLRSDELVDHFRSLWKEHYDERTVAVVKRGTSASEHLMKGSVGLVAYHRRYHPFDQGATVGLEHEIRFTVKGEREHDLIGYIDRLTRQDDGTYEVHDYKTGARLPTAQQLREDRQLALYEMGVRRSFPDVKEVKLIWHYLSHDKELCSHRTSGELSALEGKVAGLIERIEAADSFPRRTGPLCKWCEYVAVCH